MRSPLRALHPRQFRGLRLFLVITVAALAAGLAGSALLPAEHRGLAIGLILAAGLAAGWFALSGFRPVWTTIAAVIGFLFVVIVLRETGPSLLQLRGGQVEAQVMAVRESGGSADRYHYAMAAHSGRAVGGELTADRDAYRIGESVTIVEEPDGLAHPMLPSELTEHRDSWLAVTVLYLVTTVLCLLAGRPRRTEEG
ncbi:hypothetical protein Cme02nite_56290 [Catellatospora methionotrophica]|uniref:Uncharacterized protein n=1 Tax=Catellatospora methionotrophica TaxID=121620 RepID=A0A8J3PHG0_9ACTN|nr:hypothetical protein [Catellatospora methionotrophica]GIG17297.1 hypothetical protein Cme02nite_56290 [Catellatospora methionotrophica]